MKSTRIKPVKLLGLSIDNVFKLRRSDTFVFCGGKNARQTDYVICVITNQVVMILKV